MLCDRGQWCGGPIPHLVAMDTTPPSPPAIPTAPRGSRKRARALTPSGGRARKRARSTAHTLSLAQLAAVVRECAPTPPVTALQRLARSVPGEAHTLRTAPALVAGLLDALAVTVKRVRALAVVRAASRALAALAPVLADTVAVTALLTALNERAQQLCVAKATPARDKALAALFAALVALLQEAGPSRTATLLEACPATIAVLAHALHRGAPAVVAELLALLWTVTRFAEPAQLQPVGDVVHLLVDAAWRSLEGATVDEARLQSAVGTLANLTGADAPALAQELRAAGGAPLLAHALERVGTRAGRIKVLQAVRNLALDNRARADLHDHDVARAVRALLPADVARTAPSPYAEDVLATLWNLALDGPSAARLQAAVPDLAAVLGALADSPRYSDLARRYAGGALAALATQSGPTRA